MGAESNGGIKRIILRSGLCLLGTPVRRQRVFIVSASGNPFPEDAIVEARREFLNSHQENTYTPEEAVGAAR